MTDKNSPGYAGPTGRELPGEHWNARAVRELTEAARTYPPGLYAVMAGDLDGAAFARCRDLIRDYGERDGAGGRLSRLRVVPGPAGQGRRAALAELAALGAVITPEEDLAAVPRLSGEKDG